MAIATGGKGRRSITRYRVLERFADATLVECRLETGGPPHLRGHLAAPRHSQPPPPGRARPPAAGRRPLRAPPRREPGRSRARGPGRRARRGGASRRRARLPPSRHGRAGGTPGRAAAASRAPPGPSARRGRRTAEHTPTAVVSPRGARICWAVSLLRTSAWSVEQLNSRNI